MSIFNSALLITLIGMGLVFLALLLLWGMMELMMRLTARMAAAESQEGADAEAGEAAQAARPAGELAALAAAAAVAVALALRPTGLILDSTEEDHVSAWQTTMRAARLNQRAGQFYRKQRGGSR